MITMFIANDTKANPAVANLIKRTETGLETNFGNPAKKFVRHPKNTPGAKMEPKNIFGKRPPPGWKIMKFCKCPTLGQPDRAVSPLTAGTWVANRTARTE